MASEIDLTERERDIQIAKAAGWRVLASAAPYGGTQYELRRPDSTTEYHEGWVSGQDSEEECWRQLPSFHEDANAAVRLIEVMRDRGWGYATHAAPYGQHKCEFLTDYAFKFAWRDTFPAAVAAAAYAALTSERGQR